MSLLFIAAAAVAAADYFDGVTVILNI